MPTPRSGESEKEFVARCIPVAKKEDPSLSDKQAAGKCGGIYREHKKAIELAEAMKVVTKEEQAARVRADWDATYGDEPPYLYPWWVYDDYVVCSYRGRYIRINYTLADGVAIFDDPESWTLVDMDWVTAKGIAIRTEHRVGHTPIRAVEGEEGRYRAQVIHFGSDEELDLEGTYFTKATNLHLDWYKTRPWLYHHGLHPDMGVVKIGTWDKVEVNDEGVFFEGELAASFKYKEAVQALLDTKVLYPSSGALGYLVKCNEDGWLEEWPIAEASSTVTPAEFRLAAITPPVAKAVRTLEGGIAMGEPRGGVRGILDRLLHKDAETPPVEEEEEQPVTETPATEPVEADEASDAPEEVPEEEASDTPDDTSARSAEIEELLESQQLLIKAVSNMDEVIHEQGEVIKALTARLDALTQMDVEKTKAAMQGGGWFDKLHIQSRDGTPEAPSAKQASKPDVGDSPYLKIRQAQGLEES